VTGFDGFADLQRRLQSWPELHPLTNLGTGAQRRAETCLNGLDSGFATAADFAPLIRQVLLEESAVQGRPMTVRVPGSAPFPTLETWKQAKCRAIGVHGTFDVLADEWVPELSKDESPLEAAEQVNEVSLLDRAITKRSLESEPADPFWQSLLGFPTYQSSAQKQSARVVASASAGQSILIVLPTGHGKTAIAWIRMLQSVGSVTVVVVPTVILALDMERRTRELFRGRRDGSPSGRYAYTGSLAAEAKEALRQDIREGTQRIIYASPEAVVTGLSAALIAAADNRVLGTLVIDEAHLVEDWGGEFRPEFQSLAGLRQVLIDRAGDSAPVTLLMSATIGDRHLRTLETLYPGSDGKLGVVWGSALRTEPSIFIHKCENEVARDAKILDAVRCGPRPMILYTTRVRDAARMMSSLRSQGFRRVALVTGNSSESERRDVIEGWRGRVADGGAVETAYDIVVGTSAFGLGVDFSEVRSVLHACVPETLDRLYQEIGRSGRDGLPSLAVTYWAEEDLRLARGMSRTTLISTEKGWERWNAMLRGASRPGARVVSIDLNSLPAYLPEGFGRSAQWNLRTLNLMARANLIRLSQPTPSEPEPGVSKVERQAQLQEFYEHAWARIDVTILDGLVGDEDHWRVCVGDAAADLRRMEDASFSRLLRTLGAEDCIGSVLGDHFSPRRGLVTERTCRGCVWCRRTGQPVVGGFYARPPDPNPFGQGLLGAGQLPLVTGSRPAMGIWWSDSADRDTNLHDFLAAILRRSIPIYLGSLSASDLAKVQRLAPTRSLIFEQTGHSIWAEECPLVYVHSKGNDPLPTALLERLEDGLPTLYCFPRGLPSDGNPDFSYTDLTSDHMSLRTALGRL